MISTRFAFDTIRLRCIAALSPVKADPIERLVFGKAHAIDHWILQALVSLCRRREALSIEEAVRIGFPIAIKLAEAREKSRDALRTVYFSDRTPDNETATTLIKEIFGIP